MQIKNSIYIILACIVVFNIFYTLHSVNQSTLAQEQEINDIWARLPISNQCRIISYEMTRPIFSYELAVICEANIDNKDVNENMKTYFANSYHENNHHDKGRKYTASGEENRYIISFYNFENTNKWYFSISKKPVHDKVRALGF